MYVGEGRHKLFSPQSVTEFAKTCTSYIVEHACFKDVYLQNTMHYLNETWVVYILGVHLKYKEPCGSENVRADPGRGENNVTKLRYSASACSFITEDRSVIATTRERRNDL